MPKKSQQQLKADIRLCNEAVKQAEVNLAGAYGIAEVSEKVTLIDRAIDCCITGLRQYDKRFVAVNSNITSAVIASNKVVFDSNKISLIAESEQSEIEYCIVWQKAFVILTQCFHIHAQYAASALAKDQNNKLTLECIACVEQLFPHIKNKYIKFNRIIQKNKGGKYETINHKKTFISRDKQTASMLFNICHDTIYGMYVTLTIKCQLQIQSCQQLYALDSYLKLYLYKLYFYQNLDFDGEWVYFKLSDNSLGKIYKHRNKELETHAVRWNRCNADNLNKLVNMCMFKINNYFASQLKAQINSIIMLQRTKKLLLTNSLDLNNYLVPLSTSIGQCAHPELSVCFIKLSINTYNAIIEADKNGELEALQHKASIALNMESVQSNSLRLNSINDFVSKHEKYLSSVSGLEQQLLLKLTELEKDIIDFFVKNQTNPQTSPVESNPTETCTTSSDAISNKLFFYHDLINTLGLDKAQAKYHRIYAIQQYYLNNLDFAFHLIQTSRCLADERSQYHISLQNLALEQQIINALPIMRIDICYIDLAKYYSNLIKAQKNPSKKGNIIQKTNKPNRRNAKKRNCTKKSKVSKPSIERLLRENKEQFEQLTNVPGPQAITLAQQRRNLYERIALCDEKIDEYQVIKQRSLWKLLHLTLLSARDARAKFNIIDTVNLYQKCFLLIDENHELFNKSKHQLADVVNIIIRDLQVYYQIPFTKSNNSPLAEAMSLNLKKFKVLFSRALTIAQQLKKSQNSTCDQGSRTTTDVDTFESLPKTLTTNEVAFLHLQFGDIDNAMISYKNLKKLAQQLNNSIFLIKALTGIADCYFAQFEQQECSIFDEDDTDKLNDNIRLAEQYLIDAHKAFQAMPHVQQHEHACIAVAISMTQEHIDNHVSQAKSKIEREANACDSLLLHLDRRKKYKESIGRYGTGLSKPENPLTTLYKQKQKELARHRARLANLNKVNHPINIKSATNDSIMHQTIQVLPAEYMDEMQLTPLPHQPSNITVFFNQARDPIMEQQNHAFNTLRSGLYDDQFSFDNYDTVLSLLNEMHNILYKTHQYSTLDQYVIYLQVLADIHHLSAAELHSQLSTDRYQSHLLCAQSINSLVIKLSTKCIDAKTKQDNIEQCELSLELINKELENIAQTTMPTATHYKSTLTRSLSMPHLSLT